MKRQQYFQHRLQTLSALRDAVGAMRSLSAHHFRRARQALAPARTYRDEMNTLIAEIGIHQPLRAGVPAGMLVLASDLGLCGDYNSRLSRLAVAEARTHGVATVYSVGRRARGASRLGLAGCHFLTADFHHLHCLAGPRLKPLDDRLNVLRRRLRTTGERSHLVGHHGETAA